MTASPPRSWPEPHSVISNFYADDMSEPLSYFVDFQPQSDGSGRPAGPRSLFWSITAVAAADALQTGLQNLIFSAHGIRAPSAQPTRDTRKYLVEDPLAKLSTLAIERLLLAHFGVVLDRLPRIARFEVRKTLEAGRGPGKGDPTPGPNTWDRLREHLETLIYIREKTLDRAIGATFNHPDSSEGVLWVPHRSGQWSMQQPHALSALRIVVATFNLVAHELNQVVRLYGPAKPLRPPNMVVDFAT